MLLGAHAALTPRSMPGPSTARTSKTRTITVASSALAGRVACRLLGELVSARAITPINAHVHMQVKPAVLCHAGGPASSPNSRWNFTSTQGREAARAPVAVATNKVPLHCGRWLGRPKLRGELCVKASKPAL